MAAPPTTAAAQPPSSGASARSAERTSLRCDMKDSAGFEGVAPPVRRGGAVADREHVETARVRGEARMVGEEDACCAHELRALGGRHGIDAVAEAAGAPIAHLDEDDGIALAHDEIDLAVAAGVVACDEREARSFEMSERERFVAGAGVARARTL